MTWDPPGLWASIILSLSGGIVAGILVLLGEILIRMEYDRRQRMKAYKAIGLFFEEWETTISGAEAIPAQGPAPAVPKANVQFAFHGYFLRRCPNLIARWQRYLTAEQIEEVSNHLEGHQGAVIGILPQGPYCRRHSMTISSAKPVRSKGWISDVSNTESTGGTECPRPCPSIVCFRPVVVNGAEKLGHWGGGIVYHQTGGRRQVE